MEARQKILEAAVRVFAATGYRGATTRRIAQEAGVNEVTLFRQFGSKEELLREAIGCVGMQGSGEALPEQPRNPQRELTAWCSAHMRRMTEVRSFIRKCIGEGDEHTEMCSAAGNRPVHLLTQLRTYLLQLR